MPDRLPSLNALRAFEAAARHLSFSRAADELNVTKAAVSHQVKALEEALGLPLFRRLNRALLLTDAGQTLFPSITEALGLMQSAVDRLHKRDRTGELTVTTLDSFAAIWLVPRLSRFRQAHPEIDVRIATSDESIDFAQSDVDLAIRYGEGSWAGHPCRAVDDRGDLPGLRAVAAEGRAAAGKAVGPGQSHAPA